MIFLIFSLEWYFCWFGLWVARKIEIEFEIMGSDFVRSLIECFSLFLFSRKCRNCLEFPKKYIFLLIFRNLYYLFGFYLVFWKSLLFFVLFANNFNFCSIIHHCYFISICTLKNQTLNFYFLKSMNFVFSHKIKFTSFDYQERIQLLGRF